MDRMYFDLIDICEACNVYANYLARNANYIMLVESFTTPQLKMLLSEMSRCLQHLTEAVQSQDDYAYMHRDIDISK